jgi:cation transporter-like permease
MNDPDHLNNAFVSALGGILGCLVVGAAIVFAVTDAFQKGEGLVVLFAAITLFLILPILLHYRPPQH